MTYTQIIAKLKSLENKNNVAGMARFGIDPKNAKALGIPLPVLRAMAKTITPDHVLAGKLWASRIHEAKLLAGMVDEKDKVTEKQLESMALDFDTWDITDQTCDNLISDSKYACEKAVEWAYRKEEFVRRAGFTLMAMIGWYGKGCSDKQIMAFLPVIEKYSTDERNFVKKAVNWALRNIGKGSTMAFHDAALRSARRLEKSDSKSARWIAKDAIRELVSPKIIKRIREREDRKAKLLSQKPKDKS